VERTFRIFRYDPQNDRAPYYQEYRIRTEPADKVLDCLNRIRWEVDSSLAFRMSCAHGVCGSDGMRLNGVCALACQKLVRSYGEGPILIEPLPLFPVLKDLIVDWNAFFVHHREVKPFLLGPTTQEAAEQRQAPEDRAVFDEAIRCIQCACCSAACPISLQDPAFLGPAALLRAFRYLFDSRDQGAAERMELLDRERAIWGCKGHGKCTDVCPKEIDVRKWLGRIKKKIYDATRSGE
jgi:succinate dehydrogenase / fumarate reductase, iron-sulfur subunit